MSANGLVIDASQQVRGRNSQRIELFVGIVKVGRVGISMRSARNRRLMMDRGPSNYIVLAVRERRPDCKCKTLQKGILESLEQASAFRIIGQIGDACNSSKS